MSEFVLIAAFSACAFVFGSFFADHSNDKQCVKDGRFDEQTREFVCERRVKP